MRMLFAYYLPSGGMDTLNRTRGEALRQRGIDARLLYTQAGSGLSNPTACPTYVAHTDAELARIVHEGAYHAIVVASDFLLLQRLRALGYHGPLVYEVQGLGSPAHAAQFLQEAAPYITAYADALLYPPSSHLLQMLSQFPAKLHFCFQNLVDTHRFQFTPHAPAPYPILGWVGRLEPNKNWREALEIVRAVAQALPLVRLWLFEDAALAAPGEREAFATRSVQLGLVQRTDRFVNVPHHEMPHYYSVIGESGGLLLSTSLLEGFGYAVAEAMSCTCPVLSSDSDGVRHFIVPGVTGEFYRGGNCHEAAAKAIELIRNQPRRAIMRRQARAHMVASFGAERYCADMIGMLHRLG